MTVVFALAAAALFGIGAYLLLSRELVRVVFGVVVISQSAVLTLIASALTHGPAPIAPFDKGPVSAPLSQAMALTAIVIGMAVVALLLALIVRVVHAYRSDEIDEIAVEEAERDARLERQSGAQHEREEAAAR